MGTYKGIQGYSIQSLSSDPPGAQSVGQLWYNSASNVWKVGTEIAAGAWASAANYPQPIQEFPGSAGTSTAALAWAGLNTDTPAYLKFSTEYNGTSWSPTVNMNRADGAYTQGLGTQTAALSGGYYRSSSPTGVKTDSEEYNGVAWSTTNPTINALGKRTGCGTLTAALEAGGDDIGPAAPVGTSESYDGTSWADVASLGTARSMAASHNGVLTASFCIGGGTPTIVGLVEEFNGSTWTETTAINTPRKTLQGFGTTALALVFAGEGPPAGLGITESWNGSTWTEVADLATARFSGGSTTGTTNTGGLCIGGSTGPTSLTAATEEWSAPFYDIKTVTTS